MKIGINECKPKKIIILYSLVSIFMVFFSIVGTKLNNDGNIVWTAGMTSGILTGSIFGGILAGFIFYYAILFMQKLISFLGTKFIIDATKIKPAFKKPLFIGIVSGVFILLSYIPVFLAYYPGICSYDTGVQVIQIFNGDYYTHHPLLHTLFIQKCLNVGMALWGNMNAGIALYCVVQMIIFAVVFAYGISVVFKFVSKKSLSWAYIWSILLTLFCGLFEYNRYMAITVTKDGLFSVFFLLQFLAFMSLYEKKNGSELKLKKLIPLLLVYTVSLILCGMLRNNATYALILVVALEGLVCLVKWIKYLHGGKKFAVKRSAEKADKADTEFNNNLKKVDKPVFESMITGSAIVAIVIAELLLKILANTTDATPGDKREMLSIPIQQMSRTAVYHSGQMVVDEDDGTLDARTMAVIDELFLDNSFTLYEQDISDPVKRHTNTYVVRYKTKEFLYAYTTMLKEHPGDYINAAVAVENGFININDTSHAYVNQKNIVDGMGYVQTTWDSYLYSVGLSKKSLWPSLYETMEKWASENAYLRYPIIRYFYMPGIYLYIFLFALITIIKDKKKSVSLSMVFVLLYFISCLFGPTVQMRYVYPFMVLCPFMIVLTYLSNKE